MNDPDDNIDDSGAEGLDALELVLLDGVVVDVDEERVGGEIELMKV